jgi:Activator of Hsp90 ATPase homolog 1-like protein
MENKSFTLTINVNKPPHEAFNRIKDVSKWWGGKDLEGTINEFTITHEGSHYSKQKLIELIPDKRIVWHITEATLYWLQKNKHEWTNTKLIFEITPKGNKTRIQFTHEGLVLQLECYSRCTDEGWAVVIKDYLFNFIEEGRPHF